MAKRLNKIEINLDKPSSYKRNIDHNAGCPTRRWAHYHRIDIMQRIVPTKRTHTHTHPNTSRTETARNNSKTYN